MSQPQGDTTRGYTIADRDHHLVITPTHRLLSGIDLKDPAFKMSGLCGKRRGSSSTSLEAGW